MPLRIVDEGRGNIVSVPDTVMQKMTGQILLRGDGNVVTVGEIARGGTLRIEVGSNCRVDIGHHVYFGTLTLFARKDTLISVGARCGFNGAARLLCHESSRLTVGAGSLFADRVDVTTSDMHSIIDLETGDRINPARDVVIGEQVWIGLESLVLKGARVGANSIIGARSLVVGEIPPNVLAAGSPARVIRRNVTWRRDLI